MISSWALPPPALEALNIRLAELKPRLSVESGTGESTLILARHSQRVVSLEHDRKWAAHARARLEGQESDHVTIIYAPVTVVRTPRGRFPWYKAQFPESIDFALIDGPPCRIGRGAAGYQIIPNMNPTGEVWVDDYQHMTDHPCKRNREWVEAWCQEYDWRVTETLTFDMISLGEGGTPYQDHDRIAVLRKT